MKRFLFPFIFIVFGVLSSYAEGDSIVAPSAKEHLTLWNTCEAATTLQEYVEDVTNPFSKNFIKKEDRIATFDMDGTFIGELYPTYFEYNLLEERVLEDAEYKDIAPADVKETAQEIGKIPVLSFGNSSGDCAMHNYCLSNPKYKTAVFMLIADDDARDHANREKALDLGKKWRESGYYVISMKDDFKTIYGDGVEKTDFIFE